jgi:hypothetical protein
MRREVSSEKDDLPSPRERFSRRVVGRDVLGDPAVPLGLVVSIRVRAADVPEHRGGVPFGAEGAEVLAGGDRRGELLDAVVAEVVREGPADPPGGVGVVDGERVAVYGGDLRRLERALEASASTMRSIAPSTFLRILVEGGT